MSDNRDVQATIAITVPDGKKQTFPSGTTGYDIAQSVGRKLAKDALAVRVNGALRDLGIPITEDAEVEIITFDHPGDVGKKIFWHSASHIMAQAIEELFPGTKFGAGPAIEQGFYYDIASAHRFTEPDLEAIEKKMLEIGKRTLDIRREECSRKDAIAYFTATRNDPYKVEILEDTLKDRDRVSIYHQGDFADLCTGPHLSNTAQLKAVKLTNISASYWRGDAARESMQRIYGIAFPSEKLLKQHLAHLEEARKRDHRKLGAELELFLLTPEVGSGLPIWLPKGAIVRGELEAFLREEQRKRGYVPVYTPHIGNIELYKRSGHYPYYSDSQFPPLTYKDDLGREEQYLLKPMNCPHHHMIYSSKLRSYRELPLRLTEFGTVYRHEQSGELNGLIRARGFTQDDSHIYCRGDQLVDEICNAIDLTKFVFATLGFDDIEIRLSLHDPANPEKYGGSEEVWKKAEEDVRKAADRMDINYTIGIGEASFYGPKIDFIVRDALGRKWQLGTVQVDYVMPERFDLSYIGSDGKEHRPVIIHRAPFGSMERFIGVLIEHMAGNFPLWLAPVQVSVLPITEDVHPYAEEVFQQLLDDGIRAELDTRSEKIGKKIREAEVAKIPYMVIIGKNEAESGEVSLRKHRKGDQGTFTVQELREKLSMEIREKI